MSDQTPPQGSGEGKPPDEPLGNNLPEALRPGDLNQPMGEQPTGEASMSAPEPPPEPLPPEPLPPEPLPMYEAVSETAPPMSPEVDMSATRAFGGGVGSPDLPGMAPLMPPQGVYTPPPQQGGQMPPPQGGYTPQQGGYAPPPSQGGYGGGYGQPPGAPPPPPGGYGYGGPPPPPPSPMSQQGMMGLLQAWLSAVTKPNVSTYEAEANNGSWAKVLIGIAVVAVAGFLAGLVGASSAGAGLDQMIDQFRAQGQEETRFIIEFLEGLRDSLGPLLGVFALLSLITPFITFFIGAGIQYMAAKMFGGKSSDFMQFSYLASLSYAPLNGVATLLNVIPGVGGCVAFILSIYQIFCVGVSMQVSQRLDSGKAQMAAFSALVVFVLLICLCSVGLFFLIFAAAAGSGGGGG